MLKLLLASFITGIREWGGSGGLRPLGMGREDQGRAGSVFLQLGVQVFLSFLTSVRTIVPPFP